MANETPAPVAQAKATVSSAISSEERTLGAVIRANALKVSAGAFVVGHVLALVFGF